LIETGEPRDSETPAPRANREARDAKREMNPRRQQSWNDHVEDAKDAAVDTLEELTGKVESGLESLQKYVKFGSAPEVLLRIRKQFRLRVPIAPDVVVTAGTDVPPQAAYDGEAFGKEIFN